MTPALHPIPHPNNKPLNIRVWYHAECDDGFGAAWAAYTFFKANGFQRVKYEPVYYNKPHPAIETDNDLIYIVDFSYPRDIIMTLREQAARVIVLDHHKTAEAELRGLVDTTFDMNRSGAMITWNFFHSENAPRLIRYVQANDLWKHDQMPETRAVIRWLRSFPHDFKVWDQLNASLEVTYEAILQQATAIEAFFQNQIQFQIHNAHVIAVEDTAIPYRYLCPVINTTRAFSSEMCHELCKKHETRIAMSYYVDHRKWAIVSLRSIPGTDVSTIAKQNGGGGHNNAAGFEMDLQKFMVKFLFNN